LSGRPKLLFLSHTLPFPLDGGGWIRTYHTLRLLAREFDVTVLCFERVGVSRRRAGYDVARSLEALRRFGAVEVFPAAQNHSRIRYLGDHLRSVLRRRVYTDFVYESEALSGRLGELLREQRFDLVHCDTLDVSRYLPLCAGIPLVCAHFDVESAFWRRRARVEGSAARRWYYGFQAERMEERERLWGARADLNVMVSELDGARLQELCPRARWTVVPNGVDVEEFRPEPGAERGIAYIGGTNWGPNLDALRFFCEDILPHLGSAEGLRPVRWVGSASERQQRFYRERFGVELTGYVDDVRPQMRDALCIVVPLRSGGGTRLKILNSWAMAKPVVATRVGCEGLAAVDGENILVRDDPQEFAEAVRRLAGDEALRRRLGENARRTATERYSWDVIGRSMLASYRELLRRNDAAA
jgi:glycosyltransferase involved in cell wall biosynthesis